MQTLWTATPRYDSTHDQQSSRTVFLFSLSLVSFLLMFYFFLFRQAFQPYILSDKRRTDIRFRKGLLWKRIIRIIHPVSIQTITHQHSLSEYHITYLDKAGSLSLRKFCKFAFLLSWFLKFVLFYRLWPFLNLSIEIIKVTRVLNN